MKIKRKLLALSLVLVMLLSIVPLTRQEAYAAGHGFNAKIVKYYYNMGHYYKKYFMKASWNYKAGFSNSTYNNLRSLIVKRSAYNVSKKKREDATYALSKNKTSILDSKLSPNDKYQNVYYTLYGKNKKGRLIKIKTIKVLPKPTKLGRQPRGKNMPLKREGISFTARKAWVQTRYYDKLMEEYVYPKNGRYLIIDIKMVNNNKKKINAGSIELMGSDKKTYEPDFGIQEKTMAFESMLPGEIVEGKLLFDVSSKVAYSKSTSLVFEYINLETFRTDLGYIYVNR